MKITTPIATLIVDEETVIPLSLTNPMFEQQGSHSLPFSVPYNRHNLWALNLPFTPQKSTKSGQSIKATLEAYPLNETGEITVQTVTVDDRIELSFTTREGMFYAWANKTRLRELELYEVEGQLETLMHIVKTDANKPYPLSPWALFPIIVSKEREQSRFYPGDEYEYFRIFNLPELARFPGNLSYQNKKHLDFTPFLYVMYVLDKIFQNIGVFVEENDLGTIDELNRLCILNPISNPFYKNRLNLSNLLPNITVMEFIDSVLNKFNAFLQFDYRRRTVSIKFRDSNIAKPATTNIPGEINITHFEHKKIHITHDEINDDYNKVPNIQIEDALTQFNLQYSPLTVQHDPDSLNSGQFQYTTNNKDAGLFLFGFLSSKYYYFQRMEQNTDNDNENEYLITSHPLGANIEQYKPESKDGEIIAFHSKAAIHGMISTYAQYSYKMINPPHYYLSNRARLFCPTFRVGIVDPGITLNSDQDDTNWPLCFSIYRGDIDVQWAFNGTGLYPLSDKKQPFGCPFPNDQYGFPIEQQTQGEDVYPDTLSLQVMGEHGLRENFFKVTEEFYKHSGLRADVVHFNPAQMLNHNMDEKITIDGTECFLTQVNVEVSLNGLWVTGVQAITAKPLLD